MLGWNRDTNVHMVGHQVAFDNLAVLLPSQSVEDSTQLPTRLAEGGFPSPFGYENSVEYSRGLHQTPVLESESFLEA
jgi:hypothetical protein